MNKPESILENEMPENLLDYELEICQSRQEEQTKL